MAYSFSWAGRNAFQKVERNRKNHFTENTNTLPALIQMQILYPA